MDDAPNTRRALDALADLYLTGPGESAGGDPSAPRPATVEMVLLGHLPGYASPWISQYADEAAERHGGAALLRIDEDGVELELFGVNPPTDTRDRDEEGEIAGALSGGGPDELAAALEGLADRVGAWLVSPDGLSDEAVRRLGEVDRWTVLTGADDAAVVGAYRLLKGLLGEGEGEPAAGGVGLMFMGCGEAEADRAAERIGSAASAMLRSPVEKIGLRRRMQPLDRQRAGRFECGSAGPWRVLRVFFAELAEIESLPLDASPSDPAELRLTEAEWTALTDEGGEDGAESSESPVDGPSEDALMGGASASSLLDPHVAVSIDCVKPVPVDDPPADQGHWADHGVDQRIDQREGPAERPNGPSPAAGPDELAGYLPGVTMTGVRSPRHSGVRLAVDGAGRFHLMRIDGAESIDAAVRELIEARAWVVEHRPLLAMACPDHRIDFDAEPILHLFTDRPKPAMELAYAGGPDHRPIRLHMLKPVTLAGETVHVHEELN